MCGSCMGPCFVLCDSWSHFAEKEGACCLTLIVLWMSMFCSVSLPNGALSWSVVCNCAIS